ncbi:unnamed protein product [Meloidogyne enterolobii]|uniref:Uncharacterized protein n=1 Tax=Meloidogyne enterolobii TaxID=390850 RepID=A0ACB0XTL6_MELEN
MSAKPINEYSGKELLYRALEHVQTLAKPKAVKLDEGDTFNDAIQNCEWLKTEKKGVIKPDQLIKRRGKHSLVEIGTTDELSKWFNEKKGQYIQIEKTRGRLSKFILEPFVEHSQKDELYLAIYSQMNNDVILFLEEGGVDIGDVDSKARRLLVPVKEKDEEMQLNDKELNELLGKNLDTAKKSLVLPFIKELYEVYKKNHFTYLEINPLVVCSGKIYILDLAAKLDETASFLCSELWKTRDGEEIDFPAPFGRDLAKEEKHIAELDAKTGASLKLTILNRSGRIWTMVAGGGASVVFTDTICDLNGASELANYGEYSGDPSESQTFEYAKTILSIMTEGTPHPNGKVLIIGGSIANFTNVAATFKGIINAIETFAEKLRMHKVVIFVRRGGPNYQGGLRKFKEAASRLDIPIHVFGPETHMTSIVGAALGVKPIPEASLAPHTTGQFLLTPGHVEKSDSSTSQTQTTDSSMKTKSNGSVRNSEMTTTAGVTANEISQQIHSLFENNTKAIIWGQQTRAIQVFFSIFLLSVRV